MRIAICDDLPQFTQELKSRLETICAQNDWELTSTLFTSSQTILSADLSGTQVVFLDIDMPGTNGLALAKELRRKYPGIILVFVTAFIEYAPEGYIVSAFRYILKQELDRTLAPVLKDVHQKLYESSEYITLRQRDGAKAIYLSSIIYLEGTPNRRVLFHTNDIDQPIEAPGKLADYESTLRDKGFLRLQKSFVANMSHIKRISNYQVTMSNGENIRASERNYRDICSAFLRWKGQHL